MPVFKGSTPDGSDMEEVPGMYVSPCGNYWSNRPFEDKPKPRFNRRDRRKQERLLKKLYPYPKLR